MFARSLLAAAAVVAWTQSSVGDVFADDRPRTVDGVFERALDGSFDARAIRSELQTVDDSLTAGLFELFARGETENGKSLDRPLTILVTVQLQRAPRAELLALMRPLVGAEDRERRLAALELLGAVGTPQDFALATELTPRSSDRNLVAVADRRAFRATVDAIVKRHPEAVDNLAALLRGAPEALAAEIIECLGAGSGGPERLAGQLHAMPRYDELILVQLVRLARDTVPDLSNLSRRTLRGLLTGAGSTTEAVLASRILARVGDSDSIPYWIDLLEADSDAVADAALDGLLATTRLRLRNDPAAWRRWYEAELEWWRDHSSSVAAAAVDGEAAEAAVAVRELAARLTFPNRVIEELEPVLLREEGELVGMTANLLAQLGAREAVPTLIEALEHDQAGAREAVHAALVAITDRKLPLNARLWRERVLPHRGP